MSVLAESAALVATNARKAPPKATLRCDGHVETGDGLVSSSETRPPIRVLVVQGHFLLALTIVEILEADPGLIVFAARTGVEAVMLAEREKVAVMLTDSRLPDMTGAAVARIVKAAGPDTAIVFHSADYSESAMLDAIDAGATAYLTKDTTAERMVEVVRRVSRGEVLIPVELFSRAITRQRNVVTRAGERDRILADFTPRELEIMHLLAEGLDTMSMSKRLAIAPHTIEWHARHVLEKLQVNTQMQAFVSDAHTGASHVDASHGGRGGDGDTAAQPTRPRTGTSTRGSTRTTSSRPT